MNVNMLQAVHHLVEEYHSFLKTSYRFLDDHLRKQFEEHLSKAEVIIKGPYVTLARDFALGHSLEELAKNGVISQEILKAKWPFGEGRLFQHQEEALKIAREGKSFVLTTGTGSGKTEAFLLPVLDGIIRRKSQGVKGVQAILLYPMNALANDQLERMRRLLRGSGLDVSFGLYTGDSDVTALNLNEPPADTERITRADIRLSPPDIILTNYKQLEFLLIRKDDRHLFTPSLKYLVLDEIHNYRGALATEVACLIRRLKAHAGLNSGDLIAIGTSATVASREESLEALASFCSTLFGEDISTNSIIKEVYALNKDDAVEWMPPPPALTEDDLYNLDIENDEAVVAIAEKLTGKKCSIDGPIADRISTILAGNKIVKAIETYFFEPHTIFEAAKYIQENYDERKTISLDQIKLEIEAYLLVGSIGNDEHPPRLRPKLHTFFHGVYDVSLCTNPDCRSLVPHGGTYCERCGAVARPAALCRTCGQDFIKVRFEREDDNLPVGTFDFFSDENTAFLTHEIRELPDKPEEESGESTGNGNQENEHEVENVPDRSKEERGKRLESVGFCTSCGRILEEGEKCPECHQASITMFIHRGKLNTCPACGDTYTRGDIVTPLRTGTASTVAILATHHLDKLKGEDRKLLIFSDNRQDAAHQAGYLFDKHRAFALRHLIAQEVRNQEAFVFLDELPQKLLDSYRSLGLIPYRLTQNERNYWLKALQYEIANEFTRYTRQRASLENLGIVGVDYEFIDELKSDDSFIKAAADVKVEIDLALNLVKAILDTMRKHHAVAYWFFQEYIDPNKKNIYRILESEPYNIKFPERDRHPKAFALNRPDHIRKSGRLIGFIQENPKAGQMTATQKIVAKITGSRESAELFIEKIVPLLIKYEILTKVDGFPIPANERTSSLQPLQIAPRVIKLFNPSGGFRCNACQSWRTYYLPACPSPRCSGKLLNTGLDYENYYVRSYLNRKPQKILVAEHSAQISGEDRAKRETAFKEGKLNVLVCTPTLELGVDIGPLLTIVLRNAPPTPANYAQRVGRAGRRLRIGFTSTFCAAGSHDRHAFEKPEWLVAGRFDPPKLRLDNPKIITRHLRSFILENLRSGFPSMLADLLDNIRDPQTWKRDLFEDLFKEIEERKEELSDRASRLLEHDRSQDRLKGFEPKQCYEIVKSLPNEIEQVFNQWWQRIVQLNKEYKEFSKIGSPQYDEKKAAARKRAYMELTQDPERAYTLNYLATKGVLPSYQFPLDTFSLDPGVHDTPTLYRSSAVAIEEFAPGNYVYANGHKLKSIRVLFPGGQAAGQGASRTDATSSGRLWTYHFCDNCDEVVEVGKNRCPRCNNQLPAATDVVFADAFEAEENLKISADEEVRQKERQEIRETLVSAKAQKSIIYPYKLTPLEYLRLAEILITNWGKIDGGTGAGSKFWLCPDCGRHLPYNPNDPKKIKNVTSWHDKHKKYCTGTPIPFILAYKFETDVLVLNIPSRADNQTIGRANLSPTLVTLAEALLAGAQTVLELEANELSSFVRKASSNSICEQIVFYETVPGGAGYLEEMAMRLPEIAIESMNRLYGHDCRKACYLCLKRYANQRWHSFFDKDLVRDLLVLLSEQDPAQPYEAQVGSGLDILQKMIEKRVSGSDKYPKGVIEEYLKRALEEFKDLPPGLRDLEIKDEQGRLVTVPDFAWPEEKIAVYCDGFGTHGNIETLIKDAEKRNYLQCRGWVVLTFWGKMILKNPIKCAFQVYDIYRQRKKVIDS